MNRETKIKLANQFRAEELPLNEIGALLGVSAHAILRWTDKAAAAKYKERQQSQESRAYQRKYSTTPAYRAKDRKRRQTPYGWASYRVCHARIRAAKKGIPHTITADDLLPIVLDTKSCGYCNRELIYGSRGRKPESASLDRIIPAKGYIVGNIQVICDRCNRIKTDATVDELEAVARGMRAQELEHGD